MTAGRFDAAPVLSAGRFDAAPVFDAGSYDQPHVLRAAMPPPPMDVCYFDSEGVDLSFFATHDAMEFLPTENDPQKEAEMTAADKRSGHCVIRANKIRADLPSRAPRDESVTECTDWVKVYDF